MTIKDTIDTYRKRRNQLNPLFIGIIAILLVVIGVLIVIITWGNKGAGLSLFASKTPTPTLTFTPTDTLQPSDTPTITLTPSETATITPSAPYDYVVKQGDNLFKIVQDQNLGDTGIVLILLLNPYTPTNAKRPGINPSTGGIFAGQTITLPNPGMQLPSATPWPTNASPGTRISYFVLPGDSLNSIANKLRSTIDAIVAVQANKTLLVNGVSTVLSPGWVLIVPVNLVTPEPSATLTRTATGAAKPTDTLSPSATPTK